MRVRLSLFVLLTLILLPSILASCSAIPQKDRGSLADPVMQPTDSPAEAKSEAHNFPRREGSSGGGTGAGGGCGC